jgi:hypothetical protein
MIQRRIVRRIRKNPPSRKRRRNAHLKRRWKLAGIAPAKRQKMDRN